MNTHYRHEMSSFTKLRRQVTCSVHPERPCHPCVLCKKGNLSKYFHPKTFKNKTSLELLRQYEPELSIDPTSCICRNCRDDICRLSEPSFVPRWKRSHTASDKCSIPECSDPSYKVTKLVTSDQLCDAFALAHLSTRMDGYPLCTTHYGELYRFLNPVNRNCCTCNKFISDRTKFRKCPNSTLITSHLQQHTNFTGDIGSNDIVCNACYKAQLVIIMHIENRTPSLDQDLIEALKKIKSEVQSVDKIKTEEQALTHSVCRAAILVGETLLDQNAILLPEVWEYFEKIFQDVIMGIGLSPQHELHSMANPNWLLSQISVHLQQHMAYKCSVKCYGTVLYRNGGDLLHALNVSLGKSRGKSLNQSNHLDSGFPEKLLEVCHHLNKTCQKATKQTATIEPCKIEDINFEQCISNLDPDLWNAVCLITQPATSKAKSSTVGAHVRRMRRFFCACMLLFTTNPQNSFPVQTLISDVIETCGGSSRLCKFLNRLGVCNSADNHNKYVIERVEKRRQCGVLSAYPENSFSVVSVDNLDFIHSYARVYCGKQQNSWHGTTVQIVQPQPQNLLESTLHSREPERYDGPSCSQMSVSSFPHLSKRLYSMLSPAKSPNKCTPSQTRLCVQPNEERSLTIADFKLSAIESNAIKGLKDMSIDYILQKEAAFLHKVTLVDLQTYFSLSQDIQSPECSNIIYYTVLDQKCDDKETLLKVISDLHKEYILTGKKTYVFVEGDQVTYERLQSIKREYGNDLKWLLPFPGDWHFLKNYQEVLLKIYYDAGLCELAKGSGYQPNSVGSNFKRTHHFLLEVWESIYRHFLAHFLAEQRMPHIIQNTAKWIKEFPTSQTQQSTLRNLTEMLSDISEKHGDYKENFMSYVALCANESLTCKFWAQFLCQDGLAYIAMYLAIRSGNWPLRMAAIKYMAPLFTAFDRTRYQKLIIQHIYDMLQFPDEVLCYLVEGGFSVSITGKACHSVGIDEAHEMCINRECKQYVTRPSAINMYKTASYLAIRAKAIKNAETQLFPEKGESCSIITTIHAKDRESQKLEMNVQSQITQLKKSKLIRTTTDLCHLFRLKPLTPEQINNLTTFRTIGQQDYETRVEYDILRISSAKPPKRQKRLLTFTERKSRRKKVSEIERERKLQVECWKKRLEFTSKTGHQSQAFQQCIELPRAIATSNGQPVKGVKSNITKVYQKRYENASSPIFHTCFPTDWKPDTVIMEGMFLINISPWSAHKDMGEYGEFLLRQHILPHFRNGAKEVHLLFDDPGCQIQSPKYFERQHRDQENPTPDDHVCSNFSPDMIPPPKWRENVLSCRKCKRNLVCFLSNYFTKKIKLKLKQQQKFVTAGGFDETERNQAVMVTFNRNPQTDQNLYCNAEESDTRIWLHTIHSYGTKKLILSPDTDVYHIGLPVIATTDLDVLVQLSSFTSVELSLLDIQALKQAFINDPDLASIPTSVIGDIIQTLYVSTGCDFISFFTGIGKATFLNTLYEYCSFICSNTEDIPGILSNTSQGYLAFARLIGCAYFKKHKSAFLPSYPTPMSLFHAMKKPGISTTFQHKEFLQFLRERIWSKIKYEEEMIPSDEALKRHWQRTGWVLKVWQQCTSNVISYPTLNGNGWKIENGDIQIDWESNENMAQVRQTVALIRKGCGCKTGCKSPRCKCKRAGSYCFGCKCIDCHNLPDNSSPDTSHTATTVQSSSESESESESDDNSELDREVNDIMMDVFGDCDIHNLSNMED